MNATMSLENIKHYPVMLNKILSIISPQHGGTFIDCTFGGGGYSKAILKYPKTKVIALDRDRNVKKYADDLSNCYPDRFSFILNKFSNLSKIVNSNIRPKAIIFDLGFSSFQIFDHKRGFSFDSRTSLNMGMGINSCTAYDVVNRLDKKELSTIIKFLGDEKEANKIVDKIIKSRMKSQISSSYDLSILIKSAKKTKNFKINPSTKTFQALRIFVNKEITELINGLIEATKILKDGGTLIIVSFHSLEDKIVKSFFRLYSEKDKNLSRYIPTLKNNDKKKNLFSLVERNALKPTEEEIKTNNKSRSAKLRYAIRNDSKFYNPNEIKTKFNRYLDIERISL